MESQQSQSKQSLLRADIQSKYLGSFIKNDFKSILSMNQIRSQGGTHSSDGSQKLETEEEEKEEIQRGSRNQGFNRRHSSKISSSSQRRRDKSLSFFGQQNKQRQGGQSQERNPLGGDFIGRKQALSYRDDKSENNSLRDHAEKVNPKYSKFRNGQYNDDESCSSDQSSSNHDNSGPKQVKIPEIKSNKNHASEADENFCDEDVDERIAIMNLGQNKPHENNIQLIDAQCSSSQR